MSSYILDLIVPHYSLAITFVSFFPSENECEIPWRVERWHSVCTKVICLVLLGGMQRVPSVRNLGQSEGRDRG